MNAMDANRDPDPDQSATKERAGYRSARRVPRIRRVIDVLLLALIGVVIAAFAFQQITIKTDRSMTADSIETLMTKMPVAIQMFYQKHLGYRPIDKAAIERIGIPGKTPWGTNWYVTRYSNRATRGVGICWPSTDDNDASRQKKIAADIAQAFVASDDGSTFNGARHHIRHSLSSAVDSVFVKDIALNHGDNGTSGVCIFYGMLHAI